MKNKSYNIGGLICCALCAVVLCACSNESLKERVDQETVSSFMSLSEVPEVVIRIDQDEEGFFTMDGQNYSGREVIALLSSRPAGTLTNGILYYSRYKRLQDFDHQIEKFCLERKIDLFVVVPLGKRTPNDEPLVTKVHVK